MEQGLKQVLPCVTGNKLPFRDGSNIYCAYSLDGLPINCPLMHLGPEVVLLINNHRYKFNLCFDGRARNLSNEDYINIESELESKNV